MVANTYYLELMSILLNIFQPQKLMNKTMKVENLFLKRKDKRYQKKNLVASLLELIQVMQKEVMIQIMKLVKYKHLLVNLKTDKKIKNKKKKKRRKRKQNKRTRRRNKKLETLINKSKCLKWIVKDILPKYRKRKIYNQK